MSLLTRPSRPLGACAIALAMIWFCDVLFATTLPSTDPPSENPPSDITCPSNPGDPYRSGNSVTELHELEMQMWELINQDRTAPSCLEETKGRAHPLQWDPRLAAIARAHSEEMARYKYFSHEGV